MRGSNPGGYAGAVVDSKSYLRRRLQGAAVAALLCNAGVASALGFGAIRVHSALNEPLDATINLVALTPAEKTALQVDMASVDMFRRFGIERTALADRIRIVASPGNESSQVLLRLTTDAPVREPFLRFLIEADTGNGRALREYTVLLDPPGRAPATPPAANAPAAVAQPSSAARERSPSNASPAQTTSPAPSRQDEPRTDRYGPVQAGETLSRIAAGLRRPGTTLDQMQVALYRNNPQAFSDNMNILLRGAVLAIPPVERIRSIGSDEARAVVSAQQAEAVEQLAQAAPDTAAGRSGRGRELAAPTTDARLRLEPPRVDGQELGGAVGTAGFGRLTMPDFADSGADGSAATQATRNDDAGVDGDTDPMVSQGTAPSDQSSDSTRAGDTVDAATGVAPTAAGEAATGAAQADADASSDAENAVDATAGVEPAPAAAASDDAVTEAVDTDEAATTAADTAAPVDETAGTDDSGARPDDNYQPLPADDIDVVGSSGSSSLLRPRNLLLFAGGLSLVALLLAWRRRRQYKPVPLHFEAEGDRPVPPSAEEEFERPAESRQAYDAPAPNTARPSQRVERAEAQIKAGDFEQARDTLEVGLAEHPNDNALQDKRLELDYLTGDENAFMANIERFGTGLTDNGVRWAGVASMGRVLRPQDPRFALGLQDSDSSESADEAVPPKPDPESAEALYESFVSGRDSGLDDELPAAVDEDDASRDAHYFTIDDSLPDTEEAEAPRAGLDLPEAVSRNETLREDDGFDWQDQEVVEGDERQHDQGDEPGLAFDLDSTSETPPADTPKSVETIDMSEFDLDDDEAASDDDVETDPIEIRIDLARMYIEMEDNAAARELLEEVQNDGNDAQRATAEELLNKL